MTNTVLRDRSVRILYSQKKKKKNLKVDKPQFFHSTSCVFDSAKYVRKYVVIDLCCQCQWQCDILIIA